jgi:hypothetical protein
VDGVQLAFVTSSSSPPLRTTNGFGQGVGLLFCSWLTKGSDCGCGWQRSIEVMQQWLQLDGVVRIEAAQTVPYDRAGLYADPYPAHQLVALPATKTRERVVTPHGDVTVFSREYTARPHPIDTKVTAYTPTQQQDLMHELQASGACARTPVLTRRHARYIPSQHRHVHRRVLCEDASWCGSAAASESAQTRWFPEHSLAVVKHSICIA